MASYLELRNLFNDGDLMSRVEVAVMVKAQAMIAGATAAEKAWIADAILNSKRTANDVLKLVLAQNKDNSVAQIQGANDAVLQGAVDAVIPTLVDAMAGV